MRRCGTSFHESLPVPDSGYLSGIGSSDQNYRLREKVIKKMEEEQKDEDQHGISEEEN